MNNTNSASTKPKNRLIYDLLAFIAGPIGVQNLYTRQYWLAAIKIIFFVIGLLSCRGNFFVLFIIAIPLWNAIESTLIKRNGTLPLLPIERKLFRRIIIFLIAVAILIGNFVFVMYSIRTNNRAHYSIVEWSCTETECTKLIEGIEHKVPSSKMEDIIKEIRENDLLSENIKVIMIQQCKKAYGMIPCMECKQLPCKKKKPCNICGEWEYDGRYVSAIRMLSYPSDKATLREMARRIALRWNKPGTVYKEVYAGVEDIINNMMQK